MGVVVHIYNEIIMRASACGSTEVGCPTWPAMREMKGFPVYGMFELETTRSHQKGWKNYAKLH